MFPGEKEEMSTTMHCVPTEMETYLDTGWVWSCVCEPGVPLHYTELEHSSKRRVARRNNVTSRMDGKQKGKAQRSNHTWESLTARYVGPHVFRPSVLNSALWAT